MLTTFLRQRGGWFYAGLLVIVLFSSASCSFVGAETHWVIPALPPTVQKAVLPGQQIWKQNVSSFVFGTNDTEEWSAQNIENQPAIQEALRSAGFPLIRSFFLDNASDSAIDQRITTIEKSGAACLGVITNIFNVAYDLHLVRYLKNRCLLYEFGNEPDYTGIPLHQYVSQWNMLVPQLRHENPRAKFIGPVLGLQSFTYLQGFLEGVKASGVLPDAISFHWYPCWKISQDACAALADTVGPEVEDIRGMVQFILGRSLPIGVTEWNFDPGNPPAAYGDKSDFITHFTDVALHSLIQSGAAFACQFDAASYSGYGHLDLFSVSNDQPKAQYYAIKAEIADYRPSPHLS